MEAVQIASGLLEVLDPFMGLLRVDLVSIVVIWAAPVAPTALAGMDGSSRRAKETWFQGTDLHNHHVAVERPLSVGLGWTVDM